MIAGLIACASAAAGLAAMSLWGALDTRRDIARGRPRYASVGDFTGVWERARLEEALGPPDEDDRYRADRAGLVALRRGWVRVFDHPALDGLALVAACASLAAGAAADAAAWAWTAAAVALAYEVTGYALAVAAILRSR